MTSLKINQSTNDLSQPFIIPSSQEETKGTDFDLSNTNLPKIPSESLQNNIQGTSSYGSVNNKPFSNPSYSDAQLIPKENPPKPHKVPCLIKYNSQAKSDPQQKTPPFVLAQHLGPFIPPEGAQRINVERLMPSLDFATEFYEKAFKNMSFRLYLVWLSIYPVLTIALLTLPFSYFQSNWNLKNALQLPIAALVVVSWLYTPYQAYKMYKIIKNKDKKKMAWMIVLMTIFIMIGILIIVYFAFQDSADQSQPLQNIISAYISALVVHVLLTLIPAFWVKRAIVKFHRFIFLKNNLQDPEKTGIYYQYVFELLYMISEKGLLYPIKAPKPDNNKELQKGIIKTFVEGFEAAHIIPE